MYNHIVLGGTFDHLHKGHELLLTFALENAREVSVGLTKHVMHKGKKYLTSIQPYIIREKNLHSFCVKKNHPKVRIFALKDIYGSTLTDQSIDAIVVTAHTKSGAEKINGKRVKLGLPILPIIVCPFVSDEEGEILCSTNIRKGIVDREGIRYDARLAQSDYSLRAGAKAYLQRPLGRLCTVKNLRKNSVATILVGDVVTKTFLQRKWPFSFAYIDGYSQKKKFPFDQHNHTKIAKLSIQNPAGSISQKASEHVLSQDVFGKNSQVFSLRGEEDLLAVASVILLPLGIRVIYGFPFTPQSMRAITITERMKKKFYEKIICTTD